MTEERQNLYLNLIDQLLNCPNGQEPEVLEQNLELIDADFVQTLIQVAAMFSHESNQDGAEFLIFVARQLSKELGLYPELSKKE